MDRSPDPIVAARRGSCGYGSAIVLDGLDFDIRRGSIVALIGPNGAGKSTLLKTLCGVLQPIAGEWTLAGAPWSDLNARRIAQSVAYVPQEEEPKFGFTGRQIVQMGRIAKSDSIFETQDDERWSEVAMKEADASQFADRLVAELSGGERQRVLIARALAQEPALLLLDEPTAHLDFGHQISLRRLLDRRSNEGVASILAVHDLNQAARLADEIVVLDGGRIVLQGATWDVLGSPTLERVYGVSFQRWTDRKGRQWILPDDD